MSFKRYNGADKYHFRYYRKTVNHPFIVVAITGEKESNAVICLSGYMMTSSKSRVKKKKRQYLKLSKNPNPNDQKDSFVCVTRISNIPQNCFSKPFSSWHLAKEDELLIDSLEERYHKRLKERKNDSK